MNRLYKVTLETRDLPTIVNAIKETFPGRHRIRDIRGHVRSKQVRVRVEYQDQNMPEPSVTDPITGIERYA
jgi:hypothetical protein